VCEFWKNRNVEKSYEVLNFFAWGLIGEKRLSLFLRLEKIQGFYLNTPAH